MLRFMICLTIVFALAGCMQSLEDQTKKSENSIIGKTTQDVGKFDPNAGSQVSDGKINATDPITAPVSAYGPMLERISETQIKQALELFRASEDRYPRDYDEFMTAIIKANNIQLPVLPGGKKYQYDEANHKLVVIDAADPAQSAN